LQIYLQTGKLMYFHGPLFCGNPAHENMMQHLGTHRALNATLPASRQGRYPACALSESSMNPRPEGRKPAE
jgi:hypothetical protein